MEKEILVTSGYSFEGYDIIGYLGHESKHVIFGTTFLNSVNPRLTDLIEVNGVPDSSDKLDAAEESVKKMLIAKAIQAGGNAIIGFFVEYSVFANNQMGIIVNGTIVRIERKQDALRWLTFNNRLFNTSLPIRCSIVEVLKKPAIDTIQIKISGSVYLNTDIRALIANVTFKNVFQEEVTIKNVIFSSLEITPDNGFISEPVIVSTKPIDIASIEAVFVDVTKYRQNSDILKVDSKLNEKIEMSDIDLSEIKRNYGSDAVMNAIDDGDSWQCYCGNKNDSSSGGCGLCGRKHFILSAPETDESFYQLSLRDHYSLLETMKNARDIYEYFSNLNPEDNNDVVFNVLMQELKKLVEQERSYGNLKRTALSIIRNAYGITI